MTGKPRAAAAPDAARTPAARSAPLAHHRRANGAGDAGSFPAREIRPTSDRVRETLFNWLQGRVAGRRCLDLYAGSGALGLEALSRGAAHCVFVDQNAQAIAGLGDVLREWGAPSGMAELVHERAERFLARAARAFDLVFLDPPFAGQALAEAWRGCMPARLAGARVPGVPRASAQARRCRRSRRTGNRCATVRRARSGMICTSIR